MTPFAENTLKAKRQQRAREAERFAELRASLTRLVKNDDFRQWFGWVAWELCGESFGNGTLDEFTQGKRATMSFLKDSLAIADGGPDFLADLARRHFKAVAEARAKAQRDTNEKGE